MPEDNLLTCCADLSNLNQVETRIARRADPEIQLRHPTRLILVRHAQSIANAEERMQGGGDDPLTVRGEAQARQLAVWLNINQPQIDALFASPLQRAYRTAALVGATLGMAVQVRPGLRECGIGKLENVDKQTLMAALTRTDIDSVTTYGIEPWREFGARVVGTLADILVAHEGGTLLVVTHGLVISLALSHWLHGDITRVRRDYTDVRNTALSELVFDHNVTLVSYDRVDHLE